MTKSRTIQLVIAGKDRVSKMLKRITGGLKKWGVGALKITGGLVAGFGAVTVALGAMFSKLSDQIDEQAKMASALGLSNEQLGIMRDAAGYAGISVANLNTALRKMSQSVADAADGTGEAKDALKDLGLDAKKLEKMGPEKAFKQIITQLDKIPNGIKKTQMAMDIFGRSGASMANLTSKGLQQAQDDADTLGLKLSTAQAKGVEAANDSWARIKIVAGDFLKYVTAIIAPGIKNALDQAFAAVKDVNWKDIGIKMAQGLGTGVVLVLEGVEKIGTAIVDWQIGLKFAERMFLSLQLKVWQLLKLLRDVNVSIREMVSNMPSWLSAFGAGGAGVYTAANTVGGGQEGLANAKRIQAEQKLIIAQIKADIKDVDSEQVKLFGKHDKSTTALDGYIKKVKDITKETIDGAKASVQAETQKAAAVDLATEAYNRQFAAARRMNAELLKGKGGTYSVESLSKALDDEADK